MIEVGTTVEALHGQRGYVRGQVAMINGEQVKIAATHYADRDWNWRRAGEHEPVASTLLGYCTEVKR